MLPSGDSGWITLLDGANGLENWNRVGTANWSVVDHQEREGRRVPHVEEPVQTSSTSGPIGLQWGRGVVRFRKVQIRPL